MSWSGWNKAHFYCMTSFPWIALSFCFGLSQILGSENIILSGITLGSRNELLYEISWMRIQTSIIFGLSKRVAHRTWCRSNGDSEPVGEPPQPCGTRALRLLLLKEAVSQPGSSWSGKEMGGILFSLDLKELDNWFSWVLIPLASSVFGFLLTWGLILLIKFL